jgi:hypothetical protein
MNDVKKTCCEFIKIQLVYLQAAAARGRGLGGSRGFLKAHIIFFFFFNFLGEPRLPLIRMWLHHWEDGRCWLNELETREKLHVPELFRLLHYQPTRPDHMTWIA